MFGYPFPWRNHPPSRRHSGSAGPPATRIRHSIWHPWGHHRQPDRLLGRPARGTIVRLEVGALCEDHTRAPGASRTVLRTLRRQSRMRGSTFFLFSALGGMVWATAVILIGYFFGQSWVEAQHWTGRGPLLLALLLALGLSL